MFVVDIQIEFSLLFSIYRYLVDQIKSRIMLRKERLLPKKKIPWLLLQIKIGLYFCQPVVFWAEILSCFIEENARVREERLMCKARRNYATLLSRKTMPKIRNP